MRNLQRRENISATFTVTPKPVTVVTDGATKVYDGGALSATGGRAEGEAMFL